MKITEIRCHNSVTFRLMEHLAFKTQEPSQKYPKGLEIDFVPELNSFHVKHGNESVFVSKENVPFFLGELDEGATRRGTQKVHSQKTGTV